MTDLTIRQEFEKAFEQYRTDIDSGYVWSEIEHIALWAARWMAKRLEKECGGSIRLSIGGGIGYVTETEIRHLASQLGEKE